MGFTNRGMVQAEFFIFIEFAGELNNINPLNYNSNTVKLDKLGCMYAALSIVKYTFMPQLPRFIHQNKFENKSLFIEA